MTKLLLVCLALSMVYTNGQQEMDCTSSNQVDNINPFDRWMLTRQLIPYPPSQILYVDYFGHVITPGMKVSPYKTVIPPYVYYRANPDVLHTLLFIDVDVDGLYVTYRNPVLLGLVVNIPGSSVLLGNQLPYFTPAPRPGTGFHRNVHLVYAQNSPINITAEFITRYLEIRANFSLTDFIEENDLGELVAGNFFLTKLTMCDPVEEQENVEESQSGGSECAARSA